MAKHTIDELVVELGLDAKNLTAGQKKALQSIGELRSNLTSSVGEMGAALTRFGGQLAGFFLGFEGLKGVINLVKDAAFNFKQLGIQAQLLGTSVRELRTLQEFSQLAGGAPGDAAGFASNLRMQMASMVFGRVPPQFLPSLVGLNPMQLAGMDPMGQINAIRQATLAHGGQLQQMLSGLLPGLTPQVAEGLFLQSMGLSPALAAEVSNPKHFTQDMRTAQRTNRKVTDQTAENARRAANAMIDLRTNVENTATLAFPLLTSATSLLQAAFGELANLLSEIINSPFAQWVKQEFAPGGTGRSIVSHIWAADRAVAHAEQTVISHAWHGLKDIFVPHVQPSPHASLVGAGGTSDHSINVGSMTINTRATNGAALMSEIKAETRRKFDVTQADSGVVP